MRRPGRPALHPADPSAQVNLKVPGKQYDELYARAREARVSVPEIVRRDLDRARKDDARDRKPR